MAVVILAFQWLFSGAAVFYGLYNEMHRPLELRCELLESSLGNLDALREISGVRQIVRYEESVQTLSYGSYQTEVTLVGTETDHLTELYGDVLAVPLAGNMPYIVLDQSVLASMTNEKKDKLPVSSDQDHLLETFGIGAAPIQRVRIAGISHEDVSEMADADRQTRYVYTTLDGYEAIIKALGQTGNTKGAETGALPGEETSKTASYKYFIQLNDGASLEEMLSLLESHGITVSQHDGGVAELVQQWQDEGNAGRQALILFFVTFICFCMLFYFQTSLWKVRHGALIDWISQYDARGRSMKRMAVYCLIWYFLIGMGGASVLYALSFAK